MSGRARQRQCGGDTARTLPGLSHSCRRLYVEGRHSQAMVSVMLSFLMLAALAGRAAAGPERGISRSPGVASGAVALGVRDAVRSRPRHRSPCLPTEPAQPSGGGPPRRACSPRGPRRWSSTSPSRASGCVAVRARRGYVVRSRCATATSSLPADAPGRRQRRSRSSSWPATKRSTATTSFSTRSSCRRGHTSRFPASISRTSRRDIRSTLDVPAGWQAVANGAEVDARDGGGRPRTHVQLRRNRSRCRRICSRSSPGKF